MTEKQLKGYRQLLGNLIRERREAKGKSQEDLGRELNLPRQRLSELELGKLKSLDTYILIITALGGQINIIWR